MVPNPVRPKALGRRAWNHGELAGPGAPTPMRGLPRCSGAGPDPVTAFRRVLARRSFGWWVVGGAVVFQMLQSGLFMQVFGAYASLWKTEFGWSATGMAGVYTAKQLINGVSAPFQGWLIRRLGTPRVLVVGASLTGLSLIGLSLAHASLAFAAAFGAASLGMSLCGALPLTSSIVQWFRRRRAMAIAFMQEGMSIGGLLVPGVTLAIVAFGWRDVLALSGVAFIVVGIPVAALFRPVPPQRDTTRQGPADEATRGSYGTLAAVRTKAFWLLSAGHASALLVVAAVTVHLVVFLVDGHGYSLAFSGFVIGLMTLALGVGQLLGGFLGDRFSKRWVAAGAMLGHATAVLFLLAAAAGPVLVYAFAVTHGLAWGIRGPQMHALRADYFGTRSFAQIMGWSVPVLTVGQVAGPLLVGVLRDATGTYEWGLLAIAVGAVLGGVAFALAAPPAPEWSTRRVK